MGPAQRLCLGAGGRRRLGRRSALRGGHAVHQECWRPSSLLARAVTRFRFWRRRRAHHDARLQSSGDRRDLSALCRHRGFGVFRWGIGNDGSFDKQYRRRPRSFWRRITSRRQRWISEILPHLDLESVLSRTRTLQGGPPTSWCIGVLHLEPMGRQAGTIGGVLPLPHDPLKAEFAGVAVDERPRRVHGVISVELWLCL